MGKKGMTWFRRQGGDRVAFFYMEMILHELGHSPDGTTVPDMVKKTLIPSSSVRDAVKLLEDMNRVRHEIQIRRRRKVKVWFLTRWKYRGGKSGRVARETSSELRRHTYWGILTGTTSSQTTGT
jgi:hypothetical protein